jgi:hypothetical protein
MTRTYRSDHDHAVRLGELYALRALQDWARLYPEDGFQGFQVRTLAGSAITVTATSPVLPNVVSVIDSFSLYDQATGQPVPDFDPIANGATIDLSSLRDQGITSVNLRANVSPPSAVSSVRFSFDGTTVIETNAPYFIDGDRGERTVPVGALGDHVVAGTPFNLNDADGVGGVPLIIRYTVRE